MSGDTCAAGVNSIFSNVIFRIFSSGHALAYFFGAFNSISMFVSCKNVPERYAERLFAWKIVLSMEYASKIKEFISVFVFYSQCKKYFHGIVGLEGEKFHFLSCDMIVELKNGKFNF